MPVIAATVGAPILGGIIGSAAASGDREQAEKMMQARMAALASVNIPEEIGRKIAVEELRQMGIYTPETLDAISAGPSKVELIRTSPELEQAQMGALQALQARGRGGMTASDRAQLNQIRNQMAADAEAKRQQIIQQAQARGLAGGGTELAAQLSAAQAGAQQAAEAGDRLGAMAAQNALQAIMQSGQLGGDIRRQQFGEEEAKASAADAMQRFNIENQRQAAAANVGERNIAQRANLAEKQRITEQNIANRYNEQARQQEALARRAGLEIQKAGGVAGGYGDMAGMYQQRAGQTAQQWANIGSGVGQGASAYGQHKQAQDALKAYKDRTDAMYYDQLNPKTQKATIGYTES